MKKQKKIQKQNKDKKKIQKQNKDKKKTVNNLLNCQQSETTS